MKYSVLKRLQKKLYFTTSDIADILEISIPSSWVLCNRYVKKGVFLRVKKDFYILEQKLSTLDEVEFFQLANFLQVPSYISLMTALSFYDITTQILRGVFESTAVRRSCKFSVSTISFNFYKVKKEYYFGFIKKDNFFIATAEKAFIDCVYLFSLGRYSIDFSAINVEKLDEKEIKDMLKIYPVRVKDIVRKQCNI